ncbi:DUF2512 family protein [Staphylospora marina]|uniref:DUF2512 family protein n=1 Tax=Staphylospora marina TaxID=2490858 RepID=UPI000F5BFC59|nr:DUF2512 family protein [Staphylospora marina]
MRGLMLKLFTGPAVVVLADLLFRDVQYPMLYQALLTGWVLAVVGHLLEVAFLERGTLWMSNVLDFASTAVVVWLSGWLAAGARVTWVGAALTGLLAAFVEHFVHRWLLESDETTKGAA